MHGTQAPASSRQFCAHHLTLIPSPSRSGADNELGDLIVAVSDMIGTPSGERLEILGHLGRGTFGQVLKVRTPADSVFALKVIRNRQAFRRQAETEVELVRWPTAYACCCGDLKAWGGRQGLLRLSPWSCTPLTHPRSGSFYSPFSLPVLPYPQLKRLRLPKAEKGKGPPKGDARSLVVQLHDHFLYRGHLCLLFEPLGVNLLQLLQQNQCTGLSCSLIRYFSKQLLQVRPHAPTLSPTSLSPNPPSKPRRPPPTPPCP